MANILIVEDEPIIRIELAKLLKRHKHSVFEAGSITEAKTQKGPFDIVISDIRLPGGLGTELIQHFDGTPVLMMTSYASVRSAVEAMKLGAVDYIAKPFDHDEMALCVDRILTNNSLSKQNEALKSELSQQYPVQGIVGKSPKMLAVFDLLNKVAPTDTTVLIVGESGTGKELFARALHENSPRANGAIITVNCAAIPENLIETELFGHEKGAFTGANQTHQGLVEAADGGTLFLDEIGELPLEAQARLLRLLQEKESRRVGSTVAKKVDVRLVAATHRNLRQLIQEKRFREDLFFRLNVVELALPPLRDRVDDILPLTEGLLSRICKKLNRPLCTLSKEAMDKIHHYRWPGNVRELENALERAVILTDSTEIKGSLFTFESEQGSLDGEKPEDAGDSTSIESYFKRFVTKYQSVMNETELAKKLGISRKSLWERRQKLGITRPSKTAESATD